MPITVKSVFPEKTVVAVHLIVIFVVSTFKKMQIEFASQSFESWRVCLEIGFAVPNHISVVFEFV